MGIAIIRSGGGILHRLRATARKLKQETLTLYFAARDPRTPFYAKVIAGAVVAYAVSPFDLIPDFIPVLGYLDDLIIVPAGVALVLRLIPADVLTDCREQAKLAGERPTSRAGAVFIVVVWLLLLVWAAAGIHQLLT